MSNAVQTIAGEIRQHGPISFARFMELALYCPLCGYYEQEADKIGRRGDYFTSVSVGSLFGELLAFQFAAWLAELGTGDERTESGRFQIVEAGAHDGRLAGDILGWLTEHRPEIFAAVEYWILEPSPRRERWQRETLHKFAGKLRWFGDLDAISRLRRGDNSPNPEACFGRLSCDEASFGVPASAGSTSIAGPLRNRLKPGLRAGEAQGASENSGRASCVSGLNGIVFSNELLDALPVRRLGWDARAGDWFEWGVTLDGDRFAWAKRREGEASPKALTALLSDSGLCPTPELLSVLPDGFVVEVCPAAVHWWRKAARLLGRGRLLTFDYGLEADEFFMPHREHGTLRAYRQHQVTNDALANPGRQDLTAHVNFSALRSAGESRGLTTEGLSTQAQFLAGIAEAAWRKSGQFGKWDARRLRQFQTLTHPEHLGRSFRVLVQSRSA